MKILYFHQHFSTPLGATGVRSYQMSRALIAAGHQVTMVCGAYSGGKTGLEQPFVRGWREGVVDGIRVIEFEIPYSNHAGLVRRSWLFAKYTFHSCIVALREDHDLVFATSTPLTAGIPGILSRWVRRKIFVFEVRDLWPELPKAMGVIRSPLLLGALGFLEWASYKSATRLVGLAPGMVDGIQRHVPGKPVALIPNGCDFDIFDVPQNPWRPAAVGLDQLMAVFTGTHGQANGLDAVIDAAVELKRRGRQNIRFVLIGQGKLKAGLQARAKQEGLDSVVFLDPVGKSKLAGLMAGADLGLQILANVPAFYYGTSPNKFFDYIASSLPVLNNYPGWLAGMIQDEGCGFAIPPDDPSAFADALEKAADDRGALKEMGARGRALAARAFDRRVLADQFVNWLTHEQKAQ